MKKKSNLYAYLNSTKVLETGRAEDIAAMKKIYWKEYKAQWRKKQREEKKEFTIVCSQEEAKDILESARKHKGCSQSNFIKKSCLAYVHKGYIVPDLLAVNTIRQQLAMNYNALQKLFDDNKVPYNTGASLIQQMDALEKTVLAQLHNPKTLEQWVIDTIHARPEYKEILITLLNSL